MLAKLIICLLLIADIVIYSFVFVKLLNPLTPPTLLTNNTTPQDAYQGIGISVDRLFRPFLIRQQQYQQSFQDQNTYYIEEKNDAGETYFRMEAIGKKDNIQEASLITTSTLYNEDEGAFMVFTLVQQFLSSLDTNTNLDPKTYHEEPGWPNKLFERFVYQPYAKQEGTFEYNNIKITYNFPAEENSTSSSLIKAEYSPITLSYDEFEKNQLDKFNTENPVDIQIVEHDGKGAVLKITGMQNKDITEMLVKIFEEEYNTSTKKDIGLSFLTDFLLEKDQNGWKLSEESNDASDLAKNPIRTVNDGIEINLEWDDISNYVKETALEIQLYHFDPESEYFGLTVLEKRLPLVEN